MMLWVGKILLTSQIWPIANFCKLLETVMFTYFYIAYGYYNGITE